MMTEEGEKIIDSRVLSQEASEDTVERRELDLTNLEDLDLFLESAAGVYSDAIQYEEVAESDNYTNLGTDGLAGSEIFEVLQQKHESLQEMINQCRLEVIPNGGEIVDSQIEIMQQLYDDMIFLRNHIQDTYVNLSEEEEVNPPTEQIFYGNEVELTAEGSKTIKETEEEEATVFEVFKPETEVPEQTVASLKEANLTSENLFQQTEQTIDEVQAKVEVIHNHLISLFLPAEITEEIQTGFKELDICLKRISDIQEKIQVSKGNNESEAVLKDTLAIYKRVSHEIEKNAHAIEQVLLLKHKEAILTATQDPKPTVVEIVSQSFEKQDLQIVKEEVTESVEANVKVEMIAELSVCGLRVPVAGIEGITTARALREGLMVARDRHKEFQKHSEKMILVDKLVRKLADIPKEGFSEIEVSEMTKLVRMIDVPSGVEVKKTLAGVTMPEQEEVKPFESLESGEYLIPSLKRKTMKIEGDDVAENVLIQVARNSEKKLEENNKAPSESQPVSTGSSQITTDMDQETAEAVAAVESKDPLGELVPNNRQTIVHPRPIHEERSLTREYLNDKKYTSFIKDNYTSFAAFERMLDATVTQIEAQTVDVLERWLNEEYASPFVYVQDMSLAEVEELSNQPDVRKILSEKNIKYDTFIRWVDLLPEMQESVRATPNIKFGELYARWMVEGAMQFSEEREAA